MKTIIPFCLILFTQVYYVKSEAIIPIVAGIVGNSIVKNSGTEAPRVVFTASKGEKYPAQVIVDESNSYNFGLPIGTPLELDEQTRRYKPPPLSANFTADDRIQLMWNNKVARRNFCMVSPGNLSSSGITYDYHIHRYCTDDDDNNICCDGKTCDCTLRYFNCECT